MTKVTLFHANWCGHCKSFMPTWQALKKIFKENNIEFAEYEDEKDEDAIKSNNIDGFPTIRIDGDNGEYDYNGERSADAILHEILPNLQIGGNLKNKKIYHINYTI